MFYEMSAENETLRGAMERVTATLQYEPLRGVYERNELLSFFRARNLEAERKRKTEARDIVSFDGAAAYAAEKRRRFANIFGEFPGPVHVAPPARIISVRKYGGYTVENILLETMPEYFLTVNLYKPDPQGAPAPGLLFLCGHSHNGKAYGMYAAFCAEAAQNGFYTLTFDPLGQGERFYRDGSGPDSYHCHVGHQMFALGEPLCDYMMYDNIRALDYLASRTEVDPARLGVTGQSGGGQTSAFMGAYDDRLAAAAPSCYITELSDLARGIGIQEIEQTPLGFLSAGLGLSDLIIAAAPKPYLVSGGLFDFFPAEGLRDSVLEARSVYERMGGGLEVFISSKPHGFWIENRHAVIRFFCEQFFKAPPGVVLNERVEIPDEGDLYCAGGDVRTLGAVSPLVIARRRAAGKSRRLKDEDALAAAAKLLGLQNAAYITGEAEADEPANHIGLPVGAANLYNPAVCRYDEYQPGQYALYPEPDIKIYASLLNAPPSVVYPVPLAVFVGVPDELPEDAEGAVLCVEPRGSGRAALPPGCFYTDGDGPYMNRDNAVNWNAILHGRSILGMRALDIACAVGFAHSLVNMHARAPVAGAPISGAHILGASPVAGSPILGASPVLGVSPVSGVKLVTGVTATGAPIFGGATVRANISGVSAAGVNVAGVPIAGASASSGVTLRASGNFALPALFACLCRQPDVLILRDLLTSYKKITHNEEYTETLSDLAFGLGVDYDIADVIAALRGRGLRIELQ